MPTRVSRQIAPLSYCGGHLDRAHLLRKDRQWLARQLASPQTRIVPLWRNRNLIEWTPGDPPYPCSISLGGKMAQGIVAASDVTVFLGLDAEIPVFAADLSAHGEAQAMGLIGAGEFVDLRRVGPLLDGADAALLAYARGMLRWHRHHRYCGRCGHSAGSQDGGHVRVCGNPECGERQFPRTDPAVIMLVERIPVADGERCCLLARHQRLPANVYTTLAGFVEPGESLEDAVAREVLEETGVNVQEVVYQGSQPWPFPSSIMLGFRARTASERIIVDRDEVQEARWFTAAQIRGFGEWGDESAAYCLPRSDSIARHLIDSWLTEVDE